MNTSPARHAGRGLHVTHTLTSNGASTLTLNDRQQTVPGRCAHTVRLRRVVVGIRPAAPPAPRQRERVHHRPRPGLQVHVVEGTQHALRMRPGRGPVQVTAGPGFPVTGLTASVPPRRTPAPPVRSAPGAGLAASRIHRQKSRASARVAWSHPIPAAHRKRTSAAGPSRKTAAWWPSLTPGAPADTPRPDQRLPRAHRRAGKARTDHRSPQAPRSAAPPAGPDRVGHPLLRS